METEYLLQQLSKSKKRIIDAVSFANKQTALMEYAKSCEQEPTCTYRLVKRETIQETISESEDYRQQRFSF